MDSNIDKVREALEKAIANLSYYDGFDEKQWDIALAAISTIDPEAIRRECAEKICALDAKLPAMRRSSYQEGYGDALNDAEAAIISSKPAQNGRLKPLDYDEKNPCASCRADDPADCEECETTDAEHVDSMWKPKPAQDDGKPEAFASAIVKELRVNWAFDTEDALSVLNGAKRRIEEAKE